MHELHVSFIPQDDAPITTINQIIDSLEIAFKGKGLQFYEVTFGSANYPHLLIAKAQEDEKEAEVNEKDH